MTRMCIYIYIYIYTHIDTYICICIYIYIYPWNELARALRQKRPRMPFYGAPPSQTYIIIMIIIMIILILIVLIMLVIELLKVQINTWIFVRKYSFNEFGTFVRRLPTSIC